MTTKTAKLKESIAELLKDDPLFEVITDTPLEEELYADEYLDEIVEKKYYSTPEVAEWFGINDGQLRYYIKPFSEYLFTDDDQAPSSSTAIRLSFLSILKLRLIIMLKDEYRVKGLQRLIGLNGQGFVEKRPVKPGATTAVVPYEDLERKVDNLTSLVQQMLSTGLFEMNQSDDGPKIELRRDLIQENQTLKIQMEEFHSLQEERIQDEAKKIFELRNKLIQTSELRAKAIEEWAGKANPTILQRIFKAEQLEINKEKYIQEYVKTHLNDDSINNQLPVGNARNSRD